MEGALPNTLPLESTPAKPRTEPRPETSLELPKSFFSNLHVSTTWCAPESLATWLLPASMPPRPHARELEIDSWIPPEGDGSVHRK
jgi:hypothetical protein